MHYSTLLAPVLVGSLSISLRVTMPHGIVDDNPRLCPAQQHEPDVWSRGETRTGSYCLPHCFLNSVAVPTALLAECRRGRTRMTTNDRSHEEPLSGRFRSTARGLGNLDAGESRRMLNRSLCTWLNGQIIEGESGLPFSRRCDEHPRPGRG